MKPHINWILQANRKKSWKYVQAGPPSKLKKKSKAGPPPPLDHNAIKRKEIGMDHLQTGPPSKHPKKTRPRPKFKQATQVEVVQLTQETV